LLWVGSGRFRPDDRELSIMRIALMFAALMAAALGSAQPSLASYEGPWCAHRLMGGGFVENQCGMLSYEMCRANITGTGGAWCTQNPRFVAPPPGPVRRKVKRPVR
jgi:hypothetical protein